MKKILVPLLSILLLLSLFAGCQTPENTKNVLAQRTMTAEEKDAFIRYLDAEKALVLPFFEDFSYGYFYLGTVNGWDILYRHDVVLGLEPNDNEAPPYLTIGNVVFEGAYPSFLSGWNGTERKYLEDLYESGEINDEPLPDLLAAYKEAEQKRQAVTRLDVAKGTWAFQWLYWDIVATRKKFPWYAIPDEEMPWGLLPDEVIEWELQPDEWTE